MNRKLAIAILEEQQFVILKCNGNSMRPLMQPKDSLHIVRVPVAKLRAGDAVFCRVNGGLQVHKIGAIQDNRYRIENNSGFVNGWISENNIFGLLVQVNDRVLITQDNLDKR